MKKEMVTKILRKANFLKLLYLLMLLEACHARTSKNPVVVTDSTQSATMPFAGSKELCFRKISGNQNRDTLELSLHINGKKIEGELREAIFEKDQRIGTLSGEFTGRFIKADWVYLQEGIKDTLSVQFLITPAGLLMAPIANGEETGGQAIQEETGNWINIPKVICYQG